MKQQLHSVEQIIAKLRRADVELGKQRKVPEVCKQLEITKRPRHNARIVVNAARCLETRRSLS
jgi:hypothetical protein